MEKDPQVSTRKAMQGLLQMPKALMERLINLTDFNFFLRLAGRRASIMVEFSSRS